MAQIIQNLIVYINNTALWLTQWNYQGVPFLYYLIGLAVIGILLRFVF